MKKTVEYYDIDKDCSVERDCIDFHYDTENPTVFRFTPKLDFLFKELIISHPAVTIHCNEYRTKIHVDGYQQMKNGGYGKTITTITIRDKDRD